MFEKLIKKILMKLSSQFSKKGVSATIITIILLVVGMAVVLFLVIYFGKQGESQTSSIVDQLNIIRGGGGLQ